MKQAYIFQDEKSNKFWTINYLGSDLCVNYGKVGAIGKYDLKEFDSEDACEKEAKKLIASKVKKGYKEYLDFDFNNHIYIDNDEYGLHPKTSHPIFTEHFSDDIYYDCGDEETPFGSDTGADTLYEIYDQIRKKPDLDFSAFPKYLIESIWGMKYLPVDTLDKDAVIALTKEYKFDVDQSDMVTYATAFAQIKITGKVNADLKERALLSIKRIAVIFFEDGNLGEIQQKMYDDLSSFNNH